MARAEINDFVLGGDPLEPVEGASVQVTVRSSGVVATVYAAGIGPTSLTNPLTTDDRGRIDGWLDEGSYNLFVSFGSSSYTQPIEVVSGGRSVARQDVPLGIASGGFVRLQTTPIVDRSADSLGFRDPAVYCEYVDGERQFTVIGSLQEDTGNAFPFNADLGYATGPSLDDLTYQGVWLARSTLAGVLSGSSDPDYLGVSGIVLDPDTGVYHTYVVTVEENFADGGVYHLTSDSAQGPWTPDDWALETVAGELLAVDNSNPVFYDGQWVMAFQAAVDPSGNQHKLATAPSLDGPWTRVSPAMTLQGGYVASTAIIDSPRLIVDGERLISILDPIYGTLVAYDISDLENGIYLGPLFNISDVFSASPHPENGAGGSWGGGGICRIDDEVFIVYWGIENPSPSTKYPTTFVAKWLPGKVYVPTAYENLAPGTQVNNGNYTIDLPTWLPSEAFAVDCFCMWRNTGVPAAAGTESCTYNSNIGGGSNADGGITFYTPGQNLIATGQAVLPFLATERAIGAHVTGMTAGGTPGRLTVNMQGYWRLP